MARSFFRSVARWLPGMLIVIHLWLMHDLDATPLGLDDAQYFALAKQGYWKLPFTGWSLLRLPVYPLYLWGLHQLGLPVFLGTILLTDVAWLLLYGALRKLGALAPVALCCFALAVFHPLVPGYQMQVMSDNLVAPLLALLCCGLFSLARQVVAWRSSEQNGAMERKLFLGSLGAGVPLALVWLLREEWLLQFALWAVFSLFVAVLLWSAKRASRWICLSLTTLPMLGVAGAAEGSLRLANRAYYGVAVKSLLDAPQVKSAWNRLLSIPVSQKPPRVGVSREALAQAAAVSPTLARLLPAILEHYKEPYLVDNELDGAWFFWALFRAVERDQRFTEGAELMKKAHDLRQKAWRNSRAEFSPEEAQVEAELSPEELLKKARRLEEKAAPWGKIEAQRWLSTYSAIRTDIAFAQIGRKLGERPIAIGQVSADWSFLSALPASLARMGDWFLCRRPCPQVKGKSGQERFGLADLSPLYGEYEQYLRVKSERAMDAEEPIGRSFYSAKFLGLDHLHQYARWVLWHLYRLLIPGLLIAGTSGLFYRIYRRWRDHAFLLEDVATGLFAAIFLLRFLSFAVVDAAWFPIVPRYHVPVHAFGLMALLLLAAEWRHLFPFFRPRSLPSPVSTAHA